MNISVESSPNLYSMNNNNSAPPTSTSSPVPTGQHYHQQQQLPQHQQLHQQQQAAYNQRQQHSSNAVVRNGNATSSTFYNTEKYTINNNNSAFSAQQSRSIVPEVPTNSTTSSNTFASPSGRKPDGKEEIRSTSNTTTTATFPLPPPPTVPHSRTVHHQPSASSITSQQQQAVHLLVPQGSGKYRNNSFSSSSSSGSSLWSSGEEPRANDPVVRSENLTISNNNTAAVTHAFAKESNIDQNNDQDQDEQVRQQLQSQSPQEELDITGPFKILPHNFKDCTKEDLIVVISRMLTHITSLNDEIDINISSKQLTRFHSRAPPNISIYAYLSRLAHYSSLENAVLIAAVYYIDLLSSVYPVFSVNSLTVHRFLLTATTVGSKGLCDSFCSNKHYAKVGGVHISELNVLEAEFLENVHWRVVPRDFTHHQYSHQRAHQQQQQQQKEEAAALSKGQEQGEKDSHMLTQDEGQKQTSFGSSSRSRRDSCNTGTLDDDLFINNKIKDYKSGLASAEEILDLYYRRMVTLFGAETSKEVEDIPGSQQVQFRLATVEAPDLGSYSTQDSSTGNVAAQSLKRTAMDDTSIVRGKRRNDNHY